MSLVFSALAGRFFTTALSGKSLFPNHFILRKSIRPQQENYLTTPDLLSVDSYCKEQRKFYFFQTKFILTVSSAWSLNSNQWFSSVQFSLSVMSNSLRPHELQHARPPCSLPTPGVYSNTCPLSRWYHPTISSSVVPFSSHLQSFPASGSFQMSQCFASGKVLEFQLQHQSFQWIFRLISFRMDWLDLLALWLP